MILPQACLGCRTLQGSLFCSTCIQDLSLSVEVTRGLPYLNEVKSFSVHYARLQPVLSAIKFDLWSDLAQQIGTVLCDHLSSPPFEHVDIWVPVPISKARYRQRGFNQVDLLFDPIVNRFRLPYDSEWVCRQQNTPPLFSYSPIERRDILTGAFSLSSTPSLLGASVVICDDIVTSGSTLIELARLFRHHGALSVSALCVIDVQPD